MALVPKKVKHHGWFSQAQLETNLRFAEAVRRKLTAIEAKGGFTVSTHDNATAVPANSLVLLPDPNGDVTKEGHALICRGTAMISSTETKVATFRKPA